ncbi:hypothetical protein [Miltoncostaea marina]|uniref:hypothetical protein n=1 Tax=Miltoncostaea marina TaxID=2843215 RepID=UPI001C3D0DD3|nr:hypothetical protein [Miltoncostaea marina]
MALTRGSDGVDAPGGRTSGRPPPHGSGRREPRRDPPVRLRLRLDFEAAAAIVASVATVAASSEENAAATEEVAPSIQQTAASGEEIAATARSLAELSRTS